MLPCIGTAQTAKKSLPVPGEVFTVSGRTAFLISPPEPAPSRPWVWYAPTLPRLPAAAEKWMFEKFLAAGIAIAGIDVGESNGSPAGTDTVYRSLSGAGRATRHE